MVALVLMMSSLLHILLPLTLLQYKELLIPYKQYVLQGTRCLYALVPHCDDTPSVLAGL